MFFHVFAKFYFLYESWFSFPETPETTSSTIESEVSSSTIADQVETTTATIKMSEDAYAYWQNRMKSSEKKPAAANNNDSDFENDDDDDGGEDEIDFSSGSEKKFSDHDDDEQDYDYSMKDDDFAISTSFKQAPIEKNQSSSKKGANETASAAKDRLAKILEEEKKAEREAKLKEIMRQ